MQCPTCAQAELVHELRDVPYTYEGSTTALAGIDGDFRPACDEGVLRPEAIDRFGPLAQAFQQQGNAALVAPEFIRQACRKLELDQREAGKSSAASTPSRATKPARRNRRWRWPGCSACWRATRHCSLE